MMNQNQQIALWSFVALCLVCAAAIAAAIPDMPAEMASAARQEMMKQFSIGAGAYISILASLYLAFISVKKFLVSQVNG